VLSIQLPQGLESNKYEINFFVNIIDDTDGATVYYLPKPVIVMPNDALKFNLVN
jgi:hypothetical protein